jgi:NADH dehydrogenase [ubiquinone] 1 alpha subcomplex assembly factor 5
MEEASIPSFKVPQLFCPKRIRLHYKRAQYLRKKAPLDNVFSEIIEDAEEIALSHITPLKHDFKTCLVLGLWSQNLTSKLEKEFPSVRMFSACFERGPLERGRNFIQMSEEAFPFKAPSFDLIVSIGTLHTINDLPGTLLQARQCLKPDGLFVASFIGGDSFSNLRHTLYEVENKHYKRATARIHPFINPSMGTALLQRAGFSIPLVTQDRKRIAFKSIFQMVHALRTCGETSVLKGDQPYVSQTFWEGVNNTIVRNEQNLIEEDFHMITLAGRAFHPNQQKPMRQFSALSKIQKL